MLQWTLGCIYLFKIVFLFSLDKYPEIGLMDHMTVLFLTFWGTSILFSIAAAPIYIPTNSAQGFPFLLFLPSTCYFLSFWSLPFWQVWGDILLWFWFAFPWWLVMLSIFSCAGWPSVCLLQKNIYSGPLHIF